MRIVFMGSPDFAVSTLNAILEAGHDVICVYAQPPRPAGRGHKQQPCPIHRTALEFELEVRTPVSMKDPAAIDAFTELEADIAVVVAFGQILPQAVLDTPRLGCINVHASLLPRWRGAAPIQRAIQWGDGESGVSIMQMDAGLDTGPVLMRRVMMLDEQTTGGGLHDDLATRGAEACVETLNALENGSLDAVPQPEEGVTYADKLNTREARLDWMDSAEMLARTVRAFDPWPGTWFEHDGERIKVLAAHADAKSEISAAKPGTVIDSRPAIVCGSGVLVLDRLQRAGKKAQDAETFTRGYALKVGTCVAFE